MGVRKEEVQGIKTLYLSGRLDVITSEALETDLQQFIGPDVSRMIIDLGAVEFLSSSALRIFVSLEKNFRGKKGKVVFCSIPPPVRKIFKMTALEDLFETHESLEKAVSSLLPLA